MSKKCDGEGAAWGQPKRMVQARILSNKSNKYITRSSYCFNFKWKLFCIYRIAAQLQEEAFKTRVHAEEDDMEIDEQQGKDMGRSSKTGPLTLRWVLCEGQLPFSVYYSQERTLTQEKTWNRSSITGQPTLRWVLCEGQLPFGVLFKGANLTQEKTWSRNSITGPPTLRWVLCEGQLPFGVLFTGANPNTGEDMEQEQHNWSTHLFFFLYVFTIVYN